MNAPLTKSENSQAAMVPADSYISMIERVAMDPSADLEKLERMLALKERHEELQAKAASDRAFAKASAEFPEIPLNGKNKHNNTSYALLKDIISKTRPVLARHGFSLSFSTDVTERDVIVTAELAHESGHTRTNSLPLPRDAGAGRNAVQAVGSTQTYGQRYTAQAILGLSLGEDTEDDGLSAGKPAPEAAKNPSWEQTIVQDMDPNSTPRQYAEAIADALCAQWKRKPSKGQLNNEWDRRESTLAKLKEKQPDLHEKVCEAFDIRMIEITDGGQ